MSYDPFERAALIERLERRSAELRSDMKRRRAEREANLPDVPWRAPEPEREHRHDDHIRKLMRGMAVELANAYEHMRKREASLRREFEEKLSASVKDALAQARAERQHDLQEEMARSLRAKAARDDAV